MSHKLYLKKKKLSIEISRVQIPPSHCNHPKKKNDYSESNIFIDYERLKTFDGVLLSYLWLG